MIAYNTNGNASEIRRFEIDKNDSSSVNNYQIFQVCSADIDKYFDVDDVKTHVCRASGRDNTQTHTETYTQTHTYIYIYIYCNAQPDEGAGGGENYVYLVKVKIEANLPSHVIKLKRWLCKNVSQTRITKWDVFLLWCVEISLAVYSLFWNIQNVILSVFWSRWEVGDPAKQNQRLMQNENYTKRFPLEVYQYAEGSRW